MAWQDILRKKYIQNKTWSEAMKRKRDSQFSTGLMEVKDLFWWKGHFFVINGSQTRFLGGPWIENKPLMNKYPSLYNIVNGGQSIKYRTS